ncbi:polysaccharide biosynthesis/export family protein [Methylocapsa sp. S129]|uniref:polysaccharide biosynthesis/export family protein n=1 Tax=Methylocapsa sp. S129 TaxID=1641869 RepID=UPI00131BC79C|nr:polysaccharide biosynthesis/export family protein [Methylocapsa sp. S129]
MKAFRFNTRGLLPVLALLSLGGCSGIPTSGPSAGDVADQAGTAVAQQYEFVDIDSSVIDTLRHRAPDSFLAHFGDYRPSVEPHIGVGDAVSVTIWEASAGGLFSAPLVADRFTTGSNSATIPEQIVGRDGSISVPYAGRIQVIGRTTQDIQKVIEKALEGKAIQPQVLVNVAHSVNNTVTVTGEVTNGARVPLSVRGDRLLDVVAAAGGVKAPVNETYVQLSRGSASVRVALSRVISNPRENIFMRPDDELTLIRDPQTFLAYGATGRNAEIPFDAEGITLAQALAKAGGLLDYRSDPQGVFIFRYEPESVVRALRPNSTLIQHGRLTPVVYRLNLRDASSLFAEQSFHIVNRDLLYVSNAPLTEVNKVVNIFSTALSPAGSAASVYAGVR